MHQEENAFLSQGEEYARVCRDAKTGLRVEDSECEKAGVQGADRLALGSFHGVLKLFWFFRFLQLLGLFWVFRHFWSDHHPQQFECVPLVLPGSPKCR